jgi:hypothetical protein
MNSAGVSNKISTTVVVTENPSTGSLRIVSPNGGELLLRTGTHTILWSSPDYTQPTYVDIKLLPQLACTHSSQAPCLVAPITVATNINSAQRSYVWELTPKAPQRKGITVILGMPAFELPEGQYILQICESGTTSCDESDAPFTVTSSLGNLPDIDVLTPNGKENYIVGGRMMTSVQIKGAIEKVGDTISYYLLDSNNRATPIYIHTGELAAKKIVDIPIPSSILPGSYKLAVYLMSEQQVQAYDYSDNAFTITVQNSCPSEFCVY